MNLCLATSIEKTQSLPGDRFVDGSSMATTNAVEVLADAADVWPWLVQIGQNKGGFYSYSVLENLIGCQIENANEIYPEWQQLSVGDLVPIHPSANPLRVHLIQPEAHLVLVQNRPFSWSWSFVLKSTSEGRCRLLARTRIQWSGVMSGMLIWPGLKIGHYIMERRMLLGIKNRAENLQ